MKTPSRLGLIGCLLILCGLLSPAFATTYTWTTSGPSTLWSNAANWGGTGPAQANTSVALFSGNYTSGNQPTLDQTQILFQLSFTGSGWTVSSAGPSDFFTLGGGSNWGIDASGTTSGTNTVSAPITFATGFGNTGIIKSGNGSALDLTGNISGVGAVGSNITFGVASTATGTIYVSGTNTFSVVGNVSIAGATTVQLGSSTALGAATNGFSSGSGSTLDLEGNSISIGGLAGSGTITNSGGAAVLTLGAGNGGSTFTGVINNGAGTIALVKIGSGLETLRAAGTFNGGLTVNGGTLTLDFASATPTTNIVASSNTLTIGNSTLSLTGKSNTTNSQTFASTTFVAGGTIFTITNSATNNPDALVMGGLTRNVGSTVLFSTPAHTTSSPTGYYTGTGTASTILTGSGVAYATYGTDDWAAKDPTNAFVEGLSTVGGYTSNTATTLSGNTDFSNVYTTTTLGANTTITSLRLNNTAGATLALNGNTLITGGILVGSGPTTNTETISGSGSLEGIAGKDLVIIQNSTGLLTISSSIADNTSATALTKGGTGSLTLSGTNSYSGVTYLNGGTLTLGSSGAFNGGGNITFGGGTLQFSGSNTTDYSARIVNSLGAISIDTNGQNVPFATGLASSNIGGLTKSGSGTLTLSGSSAYTGVTTVNAGTLKLSFTGTSTGASVLNPLTSVVLGGGTLSILGTNTSGQTTSQTVAGLTLNQGASTIVNTVGASGLSSTLALDAIVRNVGSTVDFTLPTTGAISTVTANANFTNGQQTILGGYATVGGTTWAVSGTGATAGNITALSTYSSTFSAGLDVSPSGTVAPAAITINSLRFNNAGTTTVNTSGNLTIATGGILETSTVGNSAVSINNNNITSENGQDLVVIQNNTTGGSSTLTLASNIVDNVVNTVPQATGLTKSGAGLLKVTGTNTFTGQTTVNQGTLQVTSASGLGFGGGITFGTAINPTVVGAGATLDLNTNTTLTIDEPLVLTGATLTNSGSGTTTLDNGLAGIKLGGAGSGGSGTITVTIGAPSAGGTQATATASFNGGSTISTITTTGAGSGYISVPNVTISATGLTGTAATAVLTSVTLNGTANTITGAGSLTIKDVIADGTSPGGFTKTGAGTLTLSGTNTYSGTTTVSVGTLNLSNALAVQDSTVSSITNGIVFSSTVATHAFTFGGLAGSGNLALTDNGSNSVALSVGNNANPASYSGALSGGGSLTKIGAGIQTLSGLNTYTGVTTVSAGILSINTIQDAGSSTANSLGEPAIGASSIIGLGGGTLQYTGSGNSSNRVVNLTASSVLDASGSGAFTLTGGVTSSSSTPATLTLQGTGAGSESNTIANGASLNITSVSKTGTGAWTLTGNNSYSGSTTVSAGTLYVNNSAGSGTGSGSVTASNAGSVLAGSGTISGAVTVNTNASLSSGAAQTTAPTVIQPGLTLGSSLSVSTGNLTFALGTGTNGNGATSYSYGTPDKNSTYITMSANTSHEVTFTGTDSVTLQDLTSATLTLRQAVPYLLIQTGATDNSDFYGLITSSTDNINNLELDGDGYVMGVWAGSGNPYSDFTTISVNQVDMNGVPLTGNAIYPAAQLYLFQGDLEVVPEPGTWALLLGGLALLVVIQRRKSSS